MSPHNINLFFISAPDTTHIRLNKNFGRTYKQREREKKNKKKDIFKNHAQELNLSNVVPR